MLKHRLKEPFGKAGLTVAILALVLAMVGGAYAASKLTKPQVKEVEKIAKKFAGKPGANGTNGANGAAGKDGAAGTAGANGTSATTASFNGTKGACHEGGVEVKSASPTVNVCNGKEGSPWTAGGTLPSGKTEEGSWVLTVPVEEPTLKINLARTAISFGIPLAAAPEHVVYLKVGEGETAECPGTAANPEAAPGSLCVYAAFEVDVPSPIGVSNETFGALIQGAGGSPGGVANGSWAVTAK